MSRADPVPGWFMGAAVAHRMWDRGERRAVLRYSSLCGSTLETRLRPAGAARRCERCAAQEGLLRPVFTHEDWSLLSAALERVAPGDEVLEWKVARMVEATA